MARPFFWSRQAAVAIAILIAWLGYPVRAQDTSPVTDQKLVTLLREHHAAQNYEEALKAARRLAAMRELTLGPNHADTAWAICNMGIFLVNLGRFAESEPLLKRGLTVFEATQPYDSSLIYRTLTALERVYFGLNRDAEGEAVLKRQLAIKERSLGPKHDDLISLVSRLEGLATSAGRLDEAEAYFRRLPIETQMQSKVSMMTDLARAASRENRWADAMKTMRQVMQIVLEQHHARKKTLHSSSETPGLDNQWLFLIKLAHRFAASGGVGVDTGALAREMFEAVQWIRTSAASSSVAQMAVRARVSDPRLASILRERQDLVAEWRVKKGRLDTAFHHNNFPEFSGLAFNINEFRVDEKGLKARNDAIEKRLADIEKQLTKQFPGHGAETDVSPVSVREVQAVLRADEALILFLSTLEVEKLPPDTFVWVVTATDVKWFKSPRDTVEIGERVAALKCGLTYSYWDGQYCRKLLGFDHTDADEPAGRPLPFSLATSHELYTALLAPAGDLIKGKHLIVVPGHDLAGLPLHVLVSEATGWRGRLSEWRTRLAPDWLMRWLPSWSFEFSWLTRWLPSWSFDFSWLTRWLPNWSFDFGLQRWWYGYTDAGLAEASWLIRNHALSMMPSVSSLVALRKQTRPSAAREPFVGYGNPSLDGAPGCALPAVPESCPDEQARGNSLAMRHREAAKFVVDDDELFFATGAVNSARLRRLCPLPDTALELRCIAKSVGATTKSLFVGPAMTEAALKKAPLDRYRVIHFATHGLMEGEVFRYLAPGRREPALVMTPPANATDQDDGLLTASEIAELKLDADWVVMSACNTAGGGGHLDGLASAFFYAGARAVLASLWPVNSDAATLLTTRTFAAIKQDPSLGRAEAFRRSMLAMIGDKQRPWAAHPSYWAPFIVIGEGGTGR